MKIISLIGYSGSGKTKFILNAIANLKSKLNYEVAVIKNIHEHQIDKEGKDSYMYAEHGAQYSITKNVHNETTIFVKNAINLEGLINWLTNGPFRIDIVFTEGFRNLSYPSILCIKELEELEPQLNTNIKAISGRINSIEIKQKSDLNIPFININKDFDKFLQIFDII